MWYGKYCSYWRFGITNCPHLQGRHIRRPEGVKLQWHEERAGNCELASGISGTKRRRDSLGTVKKPCLRRQRDKHQKHNTHMSQCQEIPFLPEEITKSINQRGENAHLKSERRKPNGSSEISFDSLLGYDVVCLGRDIRTFRKNLVFPSSEQYVFCNEEICVTVTFQLCMLEIRGSSLSPDSGFPKIIRSFPQPFQGNSEAVS